MKDTTDYIVDPTYDYKAHPSFEHGDERPSNFSANATFYDVVDARLSRRDILAGGLTTMVTGVVGGVDGMFAPGKAQATTAALLGFEAVR